MFKKITALFLCFILVFSLFSCDADKKEDENAEEELKELNGSPVLQTENFVVSVSMMSYYLNSLYHNFVDNNKDSLDSMGLDPSVSLDLQKYSEGYTWLDYFLYETADTVKERILLAEGAKADGFELSEEQKKQLENELSNLKFSAVGNGKKMEELIRETYGSNVNEATIRKCFELGCYADYYSNKLLSSYSYSEEDLENYFNDHKNDILSFSYMRYRVSGDNVETAKADFEACKTEEDFIAAVKKYESLGKYGVLEEDLNEAVADCYVLGAAYSETSEFAKWAYSEGRKANEIYTSILENGTLFAAFALPAAELAYNEVLYRDMTPMHNVKSMLFTIDQYGNATKAKTQADTVLDQINNGELTFDKAMEEYNGGFTNNLTPSSVTKQLSDWIFDESKKEGDIGTITIKDVGTYVIQLQADGMASWQYFTVSMLRDESYKNDIGELSQTHVLATFNEALRQITPVTIETSN